QPDLRRRSSPPGHPRPHRAPHLRRTGTEHVPETGEGRLNRPILTWSCSLIPVPSLMLSYIIPTRNRPLRLKQTLTALESLGSHEHLGGAEVIVIDNASDEFP